MRWKGQQGRAVTAIITEHGFQLDTSTPGARRHWRAELRHGGAAMQAIESALIGSLDRAT
jgi:hypothetical protein